MKSFRNVAVIMVSAICLMGCGSVTDDGPTGPSNSSPLNSAAGDPSGAWVLVSGPSDPIRGWDVTVEIDGNEIGGTAACNGYGGTVEIGEGTIAVSELGQTEMGCQSDVQQLEQDFLGSLPGASTYKVSGDQLQLTTPEGVWKFDRLDPVPTSELVGTKWLLDGYINGVSVSNEPQMDGAFIELSDDGSMNGATNCRTLSGTWIETGSEIVFTEFSADGECPGDAAWDLDGRIISVLGDGFSAQVEDNRLTITSQGDEGLSFLSDT